MRLAAYLDHVGNLINSRRDVHIERLTIQQFESDRSALIEGRLRFWDGSLLSFSEEMIERGVMVAKQDYIYHYQKADNSLAFRYDNSPHYPDIATFPNHKHIGGLGAEQLEPASPPSLHDILREIETLLYAN
jgi:hypothetical protein